MVAFETPASSSEDLAAEAGQMGSHPISTTPAPALRLGCSAPICCALLVVLLAVALGNLELLNLRQAGACMPSATGAAAVAAGEFPVVYHPRYNMQLLGLERLHMFDTTKFDFIAEYLRGRDGVNLVHPCRAATDQELGKIHSRAFLELQRSAREIGNIMNVPLLGWLPAALLQRYILRAHRYQAAGTVLAAELAVRNGRGAVNLGGGFHHAAPGSGSGFCFFNDILLAFHHLRELGLVHHAWVVDLDIHQGNGVARGAAELFPGQLSVVDVFCGLMFPFDAEAEAAVDVSADVCRLPPEGRVRGKASGMDRRVRAVLNAHHGRERLAVQEFFEDDGYLKVVKSALAKARRTLPRPNVVFFNAGSDVLGDDPLNIGTVNLTPKGLMRRDALVFNFVTKTLRAPIVMVLSGGYGPSSASAVAQSLEQITARLREGGEDPSL